MTFEPGKSGNPAGRPTKKGGVSGLASRVSDALTEKLAQFRVDGWMNVLSGMGTWRDKTSHTRFSPDFTTDIEALMQWRSDDMSARIIEAKPSAALSKGYTIKIPDEYGGKDVAEKVHAACEDLLVDEKVVRCGHFENAYGGGVIYMVTDDLADLSEPLDASQVMKVSALHVLEPRELTPNSFYTDITNKEFRKPETWRVVPLSGGTPLASEMVVIHESRMVLFPGIKISNQILPGQRWGWGDSTLTRCNRVLADFGHAWGSAAHLLTDFAQGVLKLAGLTSMMKETDGEEKIKKRIQILDMMRSTIRGLIIDKDDEFIRTTTPISGLDDLLIQFGQRLAAAADMPMTELFGTSAAGMNATGDGDRQSWFNKVGAYQKRIKHLIERIIRTIMLSKDGPTNGVEPPVWSIEFNPMYTPSALEQAQTRLALAQADNLWFNMGAASSDDIAKSHWGGDTFSPDIQIDWAARAAQKKAEEQAAKMAQQHELAMAKANAGGNGGGDNGDNGGELPDTEVVKPDPGEESKPPEPTAEGVTPKPADVATSNARKVPVKAHDRTVRGG